MATLNEIAYNIKNLAYGGSYSIEESMDIRQIKFWINYHRANIVTENIDRGILNHHNLYQEQELSLYNIFNDSIIEFVNSYIDSGYTSLTSNTIQSYLDNIIIPDGKFSPLSPITLTTINQSYNLDPYGRSYETQQATDYWRNNGYVDFSIPQILSIDNHKAVKNIKLNRSVYDGAVEGNQTNVINVAINTGSGSKYNKAPLAEITRKKGTDLLDREQSILSVYNLQVKPLLEQNAYWLYKGTIKAIFNDPTKVVHLRNSEFYNPIQWDDDKDYYPLPDQYIKELIERVLNVEVRTSMGMPSDIVDDAADTTKMMKQSGA